ncbi:MAG TPA: methylated-DNA--[protein]-cysteine S-methyltransferase, partial [Actinomycetota bacterium]|nr:methylated-DNA--[protein]-cysteine S-methyltransferase [Actinomycetota bacterium]
MAADLNGSREGEWRATAIDTPLGSLVTVVGARGIVAADLGVAFRASVAELEARHDVAIRRDDRGLRAVRADARAYFANRSRTLSSPVDLSVARTPFWRDVYAATIDVPFGELRTYGDVAAAAGRPRAWRAAGHALRHCPVELWIPCHRIVPSGPGLGTYGGRPDL